MARTARKERVPAVVGADKIIHHIGDIATSPKTTWYVQTGSGETYTRRGDPAKWDKFEVRGGVRIRVIYQPAIGKVITAFPDDTPMPSLKKIE
ncbi:EndoU domain-containing protein [Xanthomonas oryzae]|uniref:EndoU domain-containing protein n=1 Tax=Xanthomonas oryzae TaxID=347 RepID=UPI001F3D49C8|nr:EndoU domain-containing protein [Xanthomonas oryzae]